MTFTDDIRVGSRWKKWRYTLGKEKKKKKMAQLKQEVGKVFKYLVSVTMQQVKSTGRM